MFFFLMIRRPPRSTRTDTLVPYTTLFRSMPACARSGAIVEADADPFLLGHIGHDFMAQPAFPQEDAARRGFGIDEGFQILGRVVVRSEERRVGKECVSTCRSRWSPDH